MFRTVIAFLRLCGYLIRRIPTLLKTKKLDRNGDTAGRDLNVNKVVPEWAQYVVYLGGARVEVSGEENIPADTAVAFVSNHQGYFDIPILLGYVNKPKAFISKIEILKVPLLSGWMKLMQCTFLDRKNMRQSVKAMEEAVNTVKKGYSLVIFPEGTRSRGGPVAEFKAGSFRLALKAGVPVVPVSIDGSWRIYEANKKLGKNVTVKVTIHPAIPTAGLSREESSALPEQVRAVVMSVLPPPENVVK
jgi:1-acyl-sn-glycerol-3-phosphate acyltransferase